MHQTERWTLASLALTLLLPVLPSHGQDVPEENNDLYWYLVEDQKIATDQMTLDMIIDSATDDFMIRDSALLRMSGSGTIRATAGGGTMSLTQKFSHPEFQIQLSDSNATNPATFFDLRLFESRRFGFGISGLMASDTIAAIDYVRANSISTFDWAEIDFFALWDFPIADPQTMITAELSVPLRSVFHDYKHEGAYQQGATDYREYYQAGFDRTTIGLANSLLIKYQLGDHILLTLDIGAGVDYISSTVDFNGTKQRLDLTRWNDVYREEYEESSSGISTYAMARPGLAWQPNVKLPVILKMEYQFQHWFDDERFQTGDSLRLFGQVDIF